MHLCFEDASQMLSPIVPADRTDRECPTGIIRGKKKGQPLDVVPMKMGKADIAGAVDAQVRVMRHLLAQFTDSCTGVQDDRAFWTLHQDTGSIAAKFPELIAANRN